MAEQLCLKMGGASGNSVVNLPNGYSRYWTYGSGAFSEIYKKITKGEYLTNYYNRGVHNLKGAGLSTIKLYNSDQNSSCFYTCVGIDKNGHAVMAYIGNAMTEATVNISNIDILVVGCYVSYCRIRFD